MWRLGLVASLVAGLACGSVAPRKLNLYPTVTPNATTLPTQTPAIVQVFVTSIPSPTDFAPYRASVRGDWYCRSTPDVKPDNITGYLHDGDIVTVLGTENGWSRVRAEQIECWLVGAGVVPVK